MLTTSDITRLSALAKAQGCIHPTASGHYYMSISPRMHAVLVMIRAKMQWKEQYRLQRKERRMIKVEEIKLEGGGACPEQYDATYNGEQVGYIRLRGGRLTVECPNVGGQRMLTNHFKDDAMKGEFADDEERAYWLGVARQEVVKWITAEAAKLGIKDQSAEG